MLRRIHYRVRLDRRPWETYHEGARDNGKTEGNDGTNEEAAAVVQVRDRKTHWGGSSRNEGGKQLNRYFSQKRKDLAVYQTQEEENRLTLRCYFSSWSSGGRTLSPGNTDASTSSPNSILLPTLLTLFSALTLVKYKSSLRSSYPSNQFSYSIMR